MAASYLTSNKLNNLDNETYLCINQLKVWKKGSNIDNINKLYKSMTLMKSPKTIVQRDWQICRMNKRSRSSSLIIPLLVQ